MVIYKYSLDTCTTQTFMMPAGAKILALQVQQGAPRIWALCDEKAEKVPRTFEIYGTGSYVPEEPGEYIGTYQIANGHLVFHVFEVAPK